MKGLLLGWPYVAAGLGAAILALLVLRGGSLRARLHEPEWLATLMLPVYMLHQFEEHGIDLLGRRFHFQQELCDTLGHASLAACPADAAFIAAVNVGAVWLVGVTAIVWRRREPLVAAAAWSLVLINALLHVQASLVRGAYTSGLLTAVVLFLPLGIWTLLQLRRRGLLSWLRLAAALAAGVAVHAVLLGALLAFAHGLLPRPTMLALQAGNGLVPLAIALAVRRRAAPGAAPQTPWVSR